MRQKLWLGFIIGQIMDIIKIVACVSKVLYTATVIIVVAKTGK
jgi:hypothetical protein